MLGQRRRRWLNIEPASGQRLVSVSHLVIYIAPGNANYHVQWSTLVLLGTYIDGFKHVLAQ